MTKEIITKNLYLLDPPGPSSPLLRTLVDHIFRQKRILIALLSLWTVAMAAYLIFTPPAYEAQIQFLIHNNRAGTVVSPEYNNGPVPRDYVDETVVATEIQLLSNQELLRSVVTQCGLAETNTPSSQDKALKQLQKDLKVSPVLKSNMIRASYSSGNPAEVKSVLEAVANGYLSEHVRAHASAGVYDLFDQQAQHYQKQLKQLQDQLTTFHERRNIVTLGEQKDLNLRKLLELQASRKEAEAALVANTRKITQLRDQLASLKPRITTQARVVPNQYSVERLNTMLVELQNRRTEMAAKFQPQDRLIQEIDKQIADTKAALERANSISSTEETTDVNPLRQSLEGELAKAEVTGTETRAHIASLSSAIASYQQSLSGLQSAAADDDQLLRQIKETEENFFLYSKKREEARIEEAMDRQKIANVALVEQPRLPDVPKPKLSLTFIASYTLGCFLIFGLGLSFGLTRPSVYTSWELENLTGLPVLTSIPRQQLSPAGRALLLNSIPELKHE
jgi:uncharacterized protein involved in exopolysaccharide biosynthesis